MQIFNHIDEIALSSELSIDKLGQGVSTIITKTAAEAGQLHQLLASVLPEANRFYFPDWETLPYDRYSPSPNIIGQRLDTLYRIRSLKSGVIVTSIDAILSRLCPPSYLDSHALIINVGDELPLDELVSRLSQAGFANVNQVTERGQFSRRGSLLDLFPVGSKFPIRLDYFDDEIESIRIFDVKTQLTAAKIDSVELIPSKEVDLSDSGRVCFRQSMRQLWGDKAENHAVYQRLSDNVIVGGLEYYLPLFFDETVSFFDYLPTDTDVHIERGYKSYIKDHLQSIQNRYARVSGMGGSEPLPPKEIYFTYDEWLKFLPITDSETSPNTKLRRLQIDGNPAERLQQLEKLLSGKTPLYIFCHSEGQKELLADKLSVEMSSVLPIRSFNQWVTDTDSPKDVKANQQNGLGIGYFPRSYQLQSTPKRYLLSATEFLSQVSTDDRQSDESIDPMSIIDDLSQIEIGTPVVHNEHGVGRYQGLELIEIDGESNEYITILYADDGKLFIPVTSLDMITRYTGAAPENAPMHRLDGKQWEKAKAKAKEKIHDTAAELLEIYAKRAKAKGDAITLDKSELASFAEGFPFKPTPDQLQTFDKVYQDLQKQQPMDRIVCGDVGFGKTEVALRAAFAVANSGKQVAVLVPTTLLSEQHLKNFEDRF
ncbi:MAG: DEAD/DEAH box helicase, partial [Gammaproteobacteria bacterium]|nr:DEAD/DEAH box helicase [Gammaproteobacteria bacterium]